MPTKREREYYSMGFSDAMRMMRSDYAEREYTGIYETTYPEPRFRGRKDPSLGVAKPKRKLSAWNKFVKANSKKKQFRYRDGKLNLKKMGVAFRRKKRR
jgi:hypothetical protein